MEPNQLRFQFQDRRDAYYAFDTLMELGYQPVFQDEGAYPMVQIHMERNDLTSALEIAQAHGGTLVEERDGGASDVYDTAYEMADELSIPAHIVNEDFSEAYMRGDGEGALQSHDEDEDTLFFPDETLNSFSVDRI
ncbi:DNA/RNA helicase [Marinicrinis lubricantis]|uniref:DNA/RNA helicase n=1 Tax=Marinicrinis lubricantis TaxID=2086470 RepID=A0ABW1IR42_9BACL